MSNNQTPDATKADEGRVSLDRRTLLAAAGMTAAAVAVGFGSRAESAAAPAKAPPRVRGRIDVHHHFLGAGYVKTIGRERIAAQAASGVIPEWTPVVSLQLMDNSGIETAILSVSAPGIGMDTPQATARLARECNDAQARIAADHPGRFGLFAAMPLPDIDATLKEIAYALDTLQADGIGFVTNYGGIHIGDPKFWPVFEELERRKAIAFFHPTAPFGFTGVPFVSPSTLEFPFETTRALVSMLVHGTAARFPNVRMIWSHAGGSISAMAGRINTLSARHPKWEQKGPDRFLAGLHSFYYDVTQSTAQGTYDALSAITSNDHLMFGSDVPFAAQSYIDASLTDLEALKISHSEYTALNRGTAAAMFPRFA